MVSYVSWTPRSHSHRPKSERGRLRVWRGHTGPVGFTWKMLQYAPEIWLVSVFVFFLISSMLIYVDLCCVFSLLKLKQAQWTYVVLVFLLTCRFAALVVPPLGKCLFCTQPVGSKTKASKSVSDVNFRNWSDHDIQTSCVFFYLAPFMGRRRSKWDVS